VLAYGKQEVIIAIIDYVICRVWHLNGWHQKAPAPDGHEAEAPSDQDKHDF
jgi:hypothetical protein